MSGELCCVLSLDQPYTERTTHFLSVPNNANAPLEWSEEITLLVGICSVKTATNVCLLCTFLSTVKALTKYIFNQLQMLCRKNWVMPQLQDFTTFESESDCWLVVFSLSNKSDQTTPTQSFLADSLSSLTADAHIVMYMDGIDHLRFAETFYRS